MARYGEDAMEQSSRGEVDLTFGSMVFQQAVVASNARPTGEEMAARLHEQGFRLDYTEIEGQMFCRQIAAWLRNLTPDNISRYRAAARRLIRTGITRSMAEDSNLAIGSRRDRIEFALAGALVDLEAGCDQETLDWNIMVLEQIATPVPGTVCSCGRPANVCTDSGRMGEAILPGERQDES
ncbi:hypothetical protein OG232_04555 [Streptomyces sp. NBC_01411]|uniref:hypothetical protein n=1 Tax=Streptomyces sp. NBC_01411 TaxID=2903857 RepID=UPI003244DCC5